VQYTTEKTILSRIYGNGRGWAFSPKDFSHLAPPETVHVSLHRLERRGTIRRVLRGVYDYPAFSDLLGQNLSPDVDQVARALARKFAWRIYPSGPAALNLLGLSTQVPGRFLYLSDGPTRSYRVGKTRLDFRHAAQKESSFRYPESAVIVQALKSLGPERISDEAIERIRDWLPSRLWPRILRDTQSATGWVYTAIRRICRET